MADQSDVRRIAMSLPATSADKDRFAFSVRNRDKDKGFVWVWKERVNPKKPRVPNPAVLAVRVASLDEKDFLLDADSEKFFTEPRPGGRGGRRSGRRPRSSRRRWGCRGRPGR